MMRSERRPREETRSSRVSRRGDSKRVREREKKYGTERFKQERRTPSSSKRPVHKANRVEGRHREEVEDDEEGHLIYKPGDTLQGRYKIISELGEGIEKRWKMMRRDTLSINLVTRSRAGTRSF